VSRLYDALMRIARLGRPPRRLVQTPEIPGFTRLKHAQAIGDLETLRSHGLPAERVTLTGDDPAGALRELTQRLKGVL